MTERPSRGPRAEPREIAELRALKAAQPDLASAVNMQIELVEVQRRIQARVPLPWNQPDQEWLAAEGRAGRPAVRFENIPLEWSDFRLAIRQTADILHRHEAIERADYQEIEALAHEGNALEPVVRDWYTASPRADAATAPPSLRPERVVNKLDHVLILAIRPFLVRSVEALSPRVDFSSWPHGHCPYCGWEPDFAVITPAAERRLICGRCTAQWGFGALVCPYCLNDDRTRITSFATRDGRYRVSACDVCKRYLKAYDARNATRPVLVSVDGIATLPLDAAAMQRGYVSG